MKYMCGHEILQFRIIFNSLHDATVVVSLVLKLVPNVPQKQQYGYVPQKPRCFFAFILTLATVYFLGMCLHMFPVKAMRVIIIFVISRS